MDDEGTLDRDIAGQKSSRRSRDAQLAAIAKRQHGIAAGRHLVARGWSRDAIDARVAAGRLHRLYLDVFAVGHTALTSRSRWMAAVLRVGDDAHLSFFAAAALCGLRTWGGGRIDVTVPRRVRAEPSIRVHRFALPPDEVTVRDGIPTTGPARTQFDLASVLSVDALFSVINRAEVGGVADRLSLPELLDRYPRHRGNSTLRAALELLPPGGVRTASPLEDRFYLFLRRHGLPVEGVNVSVETEARPYRCDFVWEGPRLIIETDSSGFHSGPIARSTDAERDRHLRAARWELVRLCEEHLVDEPALAAWLSERLRRSTAPRRAA